MPKYEHLFADKLTYLLINEVGFKNTNFGCLSIISTLQMGKIRSRWGKIVVLSYVDYFIYWYTSEAPGKQFVDTLGKILHVNFLVFSHWFMSIRIYQVKDHSVSVDQARCDTSDVAPYLDTATVKKSTKFIRPLFHLI